MGKPKLKLDQIRQGDSLAVMAKWPEHCVDLAFADPPYNIGYVYDQYRDNRSYEDFVGWCEQWMAACRRVLKPTGSFYIAIGDDFAAELRLIGRKLSFTLRNWIIWQYNFGQNMRTKFSRGHTHLLYFTMDPKHFTFNDHLLRYPSARHTEYQDLRASPEGRLPDDVWSEFPRVCGTFKERDGYHGCQLPEALLTRIIMASSSVGDVVLDPFVGSGTTAAVAKRLGRRYVGVDLSPEYVKRTRARLARTPVELGPHAERVSDETLDLPRLHVDFLLQLYRETGVTLNNLHDNEVALGVIARSLSLRAEAEYGAHDVRAALVELARTQRLPKLPNDVVFKPRNHVTETGKKYVRRTLRHRAHQAAPATPIDPVDPLRQSRSA